MPALQERLSGAAYSAVEVVMASLLGLKMSQMNCKITVI